MRTKRDRITFLSPVLMMLCLLAAGLAGAADGGGSGWMCPPCGHADAERVYEEPGSCPICGMELISEREWRERHAATLKVAVLLFDGVQIIDYTAPWEVFGQARMEVFTVSKTGETIETAMGMSVNPHYRLAESPAADIVLVPGGHVHDALADPDVISWIQEASAAADHVISVCNGAFLLAEAGLLDGETATTFHRLLGDLERDYPAVRVVRDRRWTDNGKVITTAGLASGIDGSLYLVSKIRGEAAARGIALHLEYEWDPESGFVRGLLADRHLPDVDLDLPDGTTVEQQWALGDRDHWEVLWNVETTLGAERILAAVVTAMEELDGWSRLPAVTGGAASEAAWSLTTPDDGSWRLQVRIAPGAGDVLEARSRLERAAPGGALSDLATAAGAPPGSS